MCVLTSCFFIPYFISTPEVTPEATPESKPEVSPTEPPLVEPESPAGVDNDLDNDQEGIRIEDVYATYYKLLSAAVSEYGTGGKSTNTDGSPQIKGVIYAELIDFNNDGLPELLFMYGDDNFFASAFCVIYTYSSGAVELLESYHLYLNHATIGIAESRNGITYLLFGAGDSFAWSDFYFTLIDGYWTEVLSLEYFINEIYDDDWNWLEDETEYYVDGVEVSEHVFDNALRTHLGVVNLRYLNIFDENYKTVDNVLVWLNR